MNLGNKHKCQILNIWVLTKEGIFSWLNVDCLHIYNHPLLLQINSLLNMCTNRIHYDKPTFSLRELIFVGNVHWAESYFCTLFNFKHFTFTDKVFSFCSFACYSRFFPSYFLFESGINPLDSSYNALFAVE